ncbi:MAG: aminomethyl-transferring glycine dehydrogenase subunit GcvPA [Candidatus Binatia bacterium]|nr:aminomethyl-transferring glycine dehydrogenase subunit GcvPA [Candidatus Binatia bacterium]
MRFFPHTPADIQAMLDTIGVANVEELFHDIPAELRERAKLSLPPGLNEIDLRSRFEELASRNFVAVDRCFLGAGAYAHFVPAVVDHILQRAEFYSAYTPYQPEVSQGTLQATYEFQTLVAMLFGMEVANASMYDGASATAEAVLMALRLRTGRNRVLVARNLHPQYRQVIQTYLDGHAGCHLEEVPFAPQGTTNVEALESQIGEDVAAVVLGYPNFFGIIEDLDALVATVHSSGALAITATAEALALGIVRPPGEFGVDIAVGEGQSFGIPLSYGGPGVGLFATRFDFVRMMPGRLVGESVDSAGRRAFVLTLATREQHIRRERATSNICTNHGLMALAFAVHLSLLGKRGLRELAQTNLARAHAVADALEQRGWQRRFSAPFFNEFVVHHPQASARYQRALAQNLLPGVPLWRWYPECPGALLLCVTELASAQAIEDLVAALG